MLKLAMVVLVLLSWASGARAACSGSGTSWSCTAGSTAAQINSAISAASDQATITLANGTYSFVDVLFHLRNGLTIACATVRGCTLTGSRPFRFSSTTSDHKTNLIRITGFIFSHPVGPVIDIGQGSGDAWIDKLRIDNNTFRQQTQGSGGSIAIGHTASVRPVWGVIDHNIFEGTSHHYVLYVMGAGEADWDSNSSLQGSGNQLYFENNTVDYDNEYLGASGSDCWRGGRLVLRYNNITNARSSVHGTCHGGPANFEVYGNTYMGGAGSDGGYRIVHHQGSGEFIVFDNVLAPSSASMALQHYRSMIPNPEGCGTCDGSQAQDGNRSPASTYHGYPCYKQPGRMKNGTLRPVYVWNNRYQGSGARAVLNLEPGAQNHYLAAHLKPNRDVYQAPAASAQTSPTSPFNGSSGMGFGTLANRPATCTPTPEAADAGNGGVGYWATDAGGNWNASNGTTHDGCLFVCTAPNTWSSSCYYKPYAYPHPLVSGVGGGSSLPPPTNLRIVQ